VAKDNANEEESTNMEKESMEDSNHEIEIVIGLVDSEETSHED
jgi:hypothetical protein